MAVVSFALRKRPPKPRGREDEAAAAASERLLFAVARVFGATPASRPLGFFPSFERDLSSSSESGGRLAKNCCACSRAGPTSCWRSSRMRRCNEDSLGFGEYNIRGPNTNELRVAFGWSRLGVTGVGGGRLSVLVDDGSAVIRDVSDESTLRS